MKTFSKYIAAAAIGTALMTSQAFAATGSLYELDSWDHPVEGHLSAEDTNIKDEALRSGYGSPVRDLWGEDVYSNQ